MSNEPEDKVFEVHAPVVIDQLGYAYAEHIGNIQAPDISTAVQIANETYGNAHELGTGADTDGYTVYHSG